MEATANLGLWAIPYDTMDWDAYIRANFSLLDGQCLRGSLTAVPNGGVVVWDGTGGLKAKAVTLTGLAKLTSGVLSPAIEGVDYYALASKEIKGIYFVKTTCVDQGDPAEIGSLAWLCNTYLTGAPEATIIIPPTTGNAKLPLLTNVIIPDNVHIRALRGASLNNTADITFSAGATFEGTFNIFSGAGSVIFAESDDEDIKIRRILPEPEWWGAVPDGSTDSTLAFCRAHLAAGPNRAVKFGPGAYMIKASSATDYLQTVDGHSYITGSGMVGVENHTQIWVDGDLGVLTSDALEFICQNIEFHFTDESNTGVFLTPTDSHGQRLRFLNNKNTTDSRKVKYSNLSFYAHVALEADAEAIVQETGEERYSLAISEFNIIEGEFFNITTHNLAGGLFIYNGAHFSLDKIKGFNSENLIFVSQNEGQYSNNFSISNICQINTITQSYFWIGRFADPAENLTGLDAVLIGPGSYNYTLNNINAISPIERCIYSQGSNVVASNLKVTNGGGFKFCGTADIFAETITINNVAFTIDRDLAAFQVDFLSKYGTKYGFESISKGSAIFVFYHYWVRSLNVSDVLVNNGGGEYSIIAANIFQIPRYVGDITISNINADYLPGSLVYGLLREGDNEPLTAPDDSWLLLDNCTIKNCTLAKPDSISIGYSLLSFNYVALAGRLPESQALSEYAAHNVKIMNNRVDFSGRTNCDLFLYDCNYIDGLYATGNTSNIPLRYNSGLPAGPLTSTPEPPSHPVLAVGEIYLIKEFKLGDDFANVGGTNETGNIFTATGEHPTTWSNGSILVRDIFGKQNSNILLKETILSNDINDTLIALSGFRCSRGSKLEFVYDNSALSDNRCVNLECRVFGKAEGPTPHYHPMRVFENSYMKMAIFTQADANVSGQGYFKFTHLPMCYSIKVVSSGGYYIGMMFEDEMVDLVGSRPYPLTSSAPGVLAIRGEIAQYSGQSVVEINMLTAEADSTPAPLSNIETLTATAAISINSEYVLLDNSLTKIEASFSALKKGKRISITAISPPLQGGHTVTLPQGYTWDGTHSIATFANLNDCLSFSAISSNRVLVLANVGNVAFS